MFAWLRFLLLVVVSAALVGASSRSRAGDGLPEELFSIGRSKNANVVRYDVRLTDRGAYDVRQPLDVYWLLRAEQGQREELTSLERRAYGYTMDGGATASSFRFHLAALPKRSITVDKQGPRYRAITPMGGAPAYVEQVFVATREIGPLSRVLYVEVSGTLVADGRAARERIAPE